MSTIKGLDALQLGRMAQPVLNPLERASPATNEAEGLNPLPKGKTAEEAATQFEGLMIQEMLKSMWRSVPKGELLSGSSEEDMYRDMLNEAVATSVSEGRGIGVRDVILKDIEKLEKK